jgi:predicted nucleic acid-binding protein
MIVLDTNVVSELMKTSPSQQVMDWRKAHPVVELFITTITQAEILLGIEVLPKGKRRAALEHAADAMFSDDFDAHILPFDTAAAREFARIAAARRKLGRPISHADAQIAAIARAHGAAVATRNAGDFEHCGITVLNPWR